MTRSSPKNEQQHLLSFCLFIYVLLHTMSQTSFYHPTTPALPPGSRVSVQYAADIPECPSICTCPEGLACILIWSEPSQLDECEDWQPLISLPVNLKLQLVSMTVICKMLHLGQKVVLSLNRTVHHYRDFINYSCKLFAFSRSLLKSCGEVTDTGDLSLRLDDAGWLAHQDEWQVSHAWKEILYPSWL